MSERKTVTAELVRVSGPGVKRVEQSVGRAELTIGLMPVHN